MTLAMENCDPETSLAYPLSSEEIQKNLNEIGNGWSIENGEITKTYELQTFNQAVALFNAIVGIAENQDHHPRLTLDYNKIIFHLSTHETRKSKEAGLTKCDFIFASKVDLLYRIFGN